MVYLQSLLFHEPSNLECEIPRDWPLFSCVLRTSCITFKRVNCITFLIFSKIDMKKSFRTSIGYSISICGKCINHCNNLFLCSCHLNIYYFSMHYFLRIIVKIRNACQFPLNWNIIKSLKCNFLNNCSIIFTHLNYFRVLINKSQNQFILLLYFSWKMP